jgi:glycosyltransferase involved in cell wall biosynthesis
VESRTLDRAAEIRFTTDAEREDASRLGFEAPATVIPHPYESRRSPGAWPAPSGVRRDDARAAPRVLFLSRIDPKKGLDLLLPAMDEVRRRVPEARLLLAGSGPDAYERAIRREIGELGLGEAVTMAGFLEGREKERALASADVFVLPSRQENFGVAAVEAMDAGLPVVLSRGVGIWREVERAGAGLVVDRAPEAVASALVDLLADPDRRERMGADGRALVRERFSPHEVGEQVSALYRRAARVRGGSTQGAT